MLCLSQGFTYCDDGRGPYTKINVLAYKWYNIRELLYYTHVNGIAYKQRHAAISNKMIPNKPILDVG